ncbi:MAG: hypothetical protein ACM3QX_18275 [Syntrophomonadaceae bacterium]
MKNIKAPLTHFDLMNMHNASSPKFMEKWQIAEENERIFKGDHWSEAQKAEHEAQGRQAISIGLTQTKLNYFLSNQRMNRTGWKVEASADVQDEVKAEIGTVQMQDVERQSNMKYLESDTYASGIAISYGVVYIGVRKDHNLNDQVYLETKDYRDVIWDSNASDYEKNKALWIATRDWCYRYQLEEEYGLEATEAIVPSDDFFQMGRDKVSYWVNLNYGGSAAYDMLSKITHYQRVLRDYYLVMFDDFQNLYGKKNSQVVAKFRDKKEADQYLRELQAGYLENFGLIPTSSIETSREEKIDKYVFTYAGILEYEETDDDTFPLAIYQAFQFQDDWWTLTDVLKSPQRWFDRLFSQIDYAFGTDIKTAYEVVVNNLAAGETLESAIQKLEDGIPIGVTQPNSISAIQGKGANPQWFQTAILMQQLIEDMTGGRSWQGLKEAAGESGVAIDIKKQQGDLMAFVFLDNLHRFKHDLGWKLIERLRKYSKAEYVVKLLGGEVSEEMLAILQYEGLYQPSIQRPGAGYVKVNQKNMGLAYLDDAAFELSITDTNMNDSVRQKRLNQMILNEQTNPFLQQLASWQELKLRYMDVPHADRLKLLQEFASIQQAQAQAAQEQANIQKAQVLQDGLKNQMQIVSRSAEADKDRAVQMYIEAKKAQVQAKTSKEKSKSVAKKSKKSAYKRKAS